MVWSRCCRSCRSPSSPRTGAPQRPDNEDRLEQQADESGGVGVQPEGICSGDELRDIPREDDDEEGGDHPADCGSQSLRCSNERQAKDQFNHTGDRDHRFWEGHPRRNLRKEGLGACEVTDPSADENSGQGESSEQLQHGRSLPWWTTRVADLVVAAVVLRDELGRVLLVRKAGTSRFMLPGGKIEENELPEHTAVREIFEEIGLTLDPAGLTPLGVFEAEAANEPGLRVRGHMFSHDYGGDADASGEIAELLWFAPGEVRSDLAPLFEQHVLPLLTS